MISILLIFCTESLFIAKMAHAIEWSQIVKGIVQYRIFKDWMKDVVINKINIDEKIYFSFITNRFYLLTNFWKAYCLNCLVYIRAIYLCSWTSSNLFNEICQNYIIIYLEFSFTSFKDRFPVWHYPLILSSRNMFSSISNIKLKASHSCKYSYSLRSNKSMLQ